jgi:hypothetical protein
VHANCEEEKAVMHPKKWRCPIPLLATLLLPVVSCLGQEAPESNDLKTQLESLKAEFDQIKTSYEARIRALEEKITEQEKLKTTIEQKQKEIEALNAKIAELENKEDVEALAGRVEKLEKKEELEVLAGKVEQLEMAEAPRHKAAPVGAYGGLMNPDISLVVDIKGLLTDNEANPADEKIMVEHSELALQGYLWPGIRADFIGAVGQHAEEGGHIHTHVEVEEAYASFLDLPADFQLQAGRKLIDFGRLNPIHSHHWPIADTPLPLRRLFGDHSWYDDGLQVTALIPNPWDIYFKLGAGVWNGRYLGHEDGDHADHEIESPGFEGPVDWRGRVFTGQASLDFLLGEDANVMTGYSIAGDEGGDNILHGVDLTLVYRWPMTYRKLRWQNEFFLGDFELEHEPHVDEIALPGHSSTYDADAWGLYSLLQLTLSKYWETGLRYDWWDSDYRDEEWSASAFLSYYFTHSMYLRPAYRYSELADGETENAFLLQFVWGLGPHAHRLED